RDHNDCTKKETVMRTCKHVWLASGLSLVVMGAWSLAANAQTPTFSSGSNGSLGAFAPTGNINMVLPPDGILHYTTVNIPAGVTVGVVANAANTPARILATGDVTIAGVLTLNGQSGNSASALVTFNPGAPPGAGGFRGGQGGSKGVTNNTASNGLGPGGGTAGVHGFNSPPNLPSPIGATYGAPSTFVSLIPLFGGSGGGGADGGLASLGDTNIAGGSGGGGGGAVAIASTTKITVTGQILANGAGGGGFNQFSCTASAGSGGAIRLVAPVVINTGTIQAVGGPLGGCSTNGGPGRIRIESIAPGQINATNPSANIVTGTNALGPIWEGSVPALINLPMVSITSVGGQAPPPVPTGSYAAPDITLPNTTTNPIPISITVTNTPVPTTFTIRLIPQFAATTSTQVNTTGAFGLSTASTSVTLANGRVSAIQAFAGFTLTASLAPIIDGEPADQVLLAAGYGEPSTLTLMTKSGKEIPVSQLSQADQVKVAKAFESMRSETR
ncbi:MAG: hypothetical protein AAB217_04905, partial [Chloroflexota bacterium]